MPARAFPVEAVRDLVGILRTLYAHAAAERGPDTRRLALIRKLATELQRATAMAAPHDPGTAPCERAIELAENAAARVAEVLEDLDVHVPAGWNPTTESLLRTASARVAGRSRKRGPTERELRWACGKNRR
ncbi:MAG TPA: hypothetical protein VHE30_18150 [Polyangiaceae bacterium]|nr:hypothetical protein [Polyangiaceae bacterium]